MRTLRKTLRPHELAYTVAIEMNVLGDEMSANLWPRWPDFNLCGEQVAKMRLLCDELQQWLDAQ